MEQSKKQRQQRNYHQPDHGEDVDIQQSKGKETKKSEHTSWMIDKGQVEKSVPVETSSSDKNDKPLSLPSTTPPAADTVADAVVSVSASPSSPPPPALEANENYNNMVRPGAYAMGFDTDAASVPLREDVETGMFGRAAGTSSPSDQRSSYLNPDVEQEPTNEELRLEWQRLQQLQEQHRLIQNQNQIIEQQERRMQQLEQTAQHIRALERMLQVPPVEATRVQTTTITAAADDEEAFVAEVVPWHPVLRSPRPTLPSPPSPVVVEAEIVPESERNYKECCCYKWNDRSKRCWRIGIIALGLFLLLAVVIAVISVSAGGGGGGGDGVGDDDEASDAVVESTPSEAPLAPTMAPTIAPVPDSTTEIPTDELPSATPATLSPTARPTTTVPETEIPTQAPTEAQSSISLTQVPTDFSVSPPTQGPTPEPTPKPTIAPTLWPTQQPTPEPTTKPTPAPTAKPTPESTSKPTTLEPTEKWATSEPITPAPTPEPTPKSTPGPTPAPPTDPPMEAPTMPPTPPSPINITWTRLGPPLEGENVGDRFGVALAITADGKRVAVGAYTSDGPNGSLFNAGHVRVYDYNDRSDTWNSIGKALHGENAGDQFGRSVALSADGSVVAAGGSGNDGNGTDSGVVQVFTFKNKQWIQMGDDIYGLAANDWLGRSIALSANGTVVASGADGGDINGDRSGYVRVLQFNGSAWNQMGQTLTGHAARDSFGKSISLSEDGTIMAVGAIGVDSALRNIPNVGQVLIFQFNKTSLRWEEHGQPLFGVAKGDNFGNSIDLSSDGLILAAGGYRYDDAETGKDAGVVNVFQSNGTSWKQISQSIVGGFLGDHFGVSVSLAVRKEKILLAAGASMHDGVGGMNSGNVRLFVYSVQNKQWFPTTPSFEGESSGDRFGSAVVLSKSASVLAVGAYQHNQSAGQVQLFRIENDFIFGET